MAYNHESSINKVAKLFVEQYNNTIRYYPKSDTWCSKDRKHTIDSKQWWPETSNDPWKYINGITIMMLMKDISKEHKIRYKQGYNERYQYEDVVKLLESTHQMDATSKDLA